MNAYFGLGSIFIKLNIGCVFGVMIVVKVGIWYFGDIE
jgi:hypothetical protein